MLMNRGCVGRRVVPTHRTPGYAALGDPYAAVRTCAVRVPHHGAGGESVREADRLRLVRALLVMVAAVDQLAWICSKQR